MTVRDYEVARRKMVETQIAARGIRDPKVLEVMRQIPRHLFLDEGMWDQAYQDHPLPIGEKQTISQPYIVALMTEALELTPSDKVLEIGTGSGYQTAILASLCDWVYSVERIRSLALKARRVLDELRLYNVSIKIGDGTEGWPEHAPYQAILVTAGAPEIPLPLKEQLAEGGRLVIPVGDRFSQSLYKLVKRKEEFHQEDLGGCRFVDLVGKYGWNT
ncbi:MAG: protein-L-isoaspartate(D-aspartate) O-methyltransferase [Thermodesulfobacteriota bacterium]